MDCTPKEIMTIMASRLITNDDIVFAGTGLSMIAATAAKRIQAPQAVVFFETGGIDPGLEELPVAVADPRVMSGTSMNSGLIDAFSVLVNPRLRTVAFLGAAQIDRYGNLNSTMLGDFLNPKVRFSGCGGACDAASQGFGYIVFMQHEKRRFVDKVDYRSSVGWLEGGASRSRAGMKRGGPSAVVTNLCLMKFDNESHAMYLDSYYPGVSPQKVAENTGFELDLSRARQAEPPTEKELRILREEVDPQRLILG